MEFYDDPRRAQIEPMHEFMQTWARWGRYHSIRQESMTYKIMMWMRDHSKRVEDIREGIVLGQPIHCQDDDYEKIAWKVERLLTNQDLWSGHIRERDILKTYYKLPYASSLGFIARKLECKPWLVEKTVKDALYFMSTIWRD